MTQIAGKRALATGGSRGIGRAIAPVLSRAGAHVAVNDREGVADVEATRRRHNGRSSRAVAGAMIVRADVGQRLEVDRMVEETEMVTSNPNALKDLVPVGRFGPG